MAKYHHATELKDHIFDSTESKVYFSGADQRQCAHFGCKNALTLMESLAGKLCTGHMNEKKIDVMKIIQH